MQINYPIHQSILQKVQEVKKEINTKEFCKFHGISESKFSRFPSEKFIKELELLDYMIQFENSSDYFKHLKTKKMKKVILILVVALTMPFLSCNNETDELIQLSEEQELRMEYQNKSMQYLIDNFNDVPDAFVLFGINGFGGGMALYFRKEITEAETSNNILAFYYDVNEMIRDVQIFVTNLRDFEDKEEIKSALVPNDTDAEVMTFEEWLNRDTHDSPSKSFLDRPRND